MKNLGRNGGTPVRRKPFTRWPSFDEDTIKAGACITQSIPPGQTWCGVPAKVVRIATLKEGIK